MRIPRQALLSAALFASRGPSNVLSAGAARSGVSPVVAFAYLANRNPRFLRYSSSTRRANRPAITARSMSDETEAAQKAAASRKEGGGVGGGGSDGAGPPTIFDKIVAGDIPSDKVHEDDLALAFRDVTPQAPTHILVIPKNRDGLVGLSNAREDQKDLLGHLVYVAGEIGRRECPEGFRLVINDGRHGGQSVYHLHIHVMGGRQMQWPPG